MLEGVNVVAELEQAGILYTFSSNEQVKCRCVFHNDSTPSAVFTVRTGTFKCYACEAKGDIADFLARATGKDRSDVLLYLNKRYNLTAGLRPISMDLVESAHSQIFTAAGPLLEELRKRCITDDIIRKRRLGYRDGRITIPIFDPSGNACINIRKYLPGAPGDQKMQNTKGRKKLALYPHDQLKFDHIVFCGGEMKALVAAEQLNKHGIGAVCVTAGEGEWDIDLNSFLVNKKVTILLDIDAKGQKATIKLARQFISLTKEVYTAKLPLDIALYPTGDINDFVALGNDLYDTIEKAKAYDPRISVVDWGSGEYIERTINEAVSSENIGTRSAVSCLITGVTEQRYSVPASVQVLCTRGSKHCGSCPVAILDKDLFAIPAESPNVIAMVDVSEDSLRRVLDRELNIPPRCDEHSYSTTHRRDAEIALISPALELKATSSEERSVQKAIILEGGIQANEEYTLKCRAQPDPSTQETVLLVSDAVKKTSALSRYDFDSSDLCERFKPAVWTLDGLSALLDDVYDDLECITGIRQRKLLHLVMDLAYHSPLYIKPERNIERGWVEVLIIGDSSQGKTQAATMMQQHYRLGHKVDAKNASTAGLIGGLQKMGGMWLITWGALPTHDQRLVIFEELKGAKVEVISALTDVRSSGVATLEKIRAGRRAARTRLIALSNPRSIRPMNSYGHGVEAILELMGAPEDVRRFDACLCVAKEDMETDVIHTLVNITRDNLYTSDACHHLIMWAWTRKPEQIKYPTQTWGAILDASKRFCKKYSEQIPIVDSGSMRLKLARLCASLALRTFSTEDNETCIVRECHVHYIERVLNEIYDSKSMGYNIFSSRQQRLLQVLDEQDIRSRLLAVPYPRHLVDHLHGSSWLSPNELAAHAGLAAEDAEQLMNCLARSYAVTQKGKSYIATPGFRTLLTQMMKEEIRDGF